MHRLPKSLTILVLLVTSTLLLPVHANEPLAAKWEAHQVRFNYSGFGTHYTCEGLRYKVKKLLLEIGARDDVRIESTCTGSFNETQRFHKLLLAFAVPVAAEATDITEETFPAQWEQIRIRQNHPRDLGPNECELIEQFNRQVVQKIGARDINDKTRCIPRRFSFNAINLYMTVLKQQEGLVLEPEQK